MPDPHLPLGRPRREVAPGAVHLPGWLSAEDQRRLVAACRAWARAPVPMRAARLPSGHLMSVRTVCLGWHWRPYRYTRTAEDAGGGRVAAVPAWLGEMGRQAVADAGVGDGDYHPDTALINHYDHHARLGLHQDRDERVNEPVVSLSVGDTCVFRFGSPAARHGPATDLELVSGDLFVFGGPSRFAYHGVPRIFPGTAPVDLGPTPGRWNITMRVTGLG